MAKTPQALACGVSIFRYEKVTYTCGDTIGFSLWSINFIASNAGDEHS